MKRLLSLASTGLMTGALLDPVLQSGLGRPIPWLRDVLMFAGGILCLYLLIRFRKDL